jgi:hypothetical protein
MRSITTACWELMRSVMVLGCLSWRSELSEVMLRAIEAGLPDRPLLLGPARDLLEWGGVEGARSELGLLPADHKPGSFQPLDVVRDGRKGYLKRLGELADRGLIVVEVSQDRSPGCVGQCGVVSSSRSSSAESATTPRTFLSGQITAKEVHASSGPVNGSLNGWRRGG